MDQMMRMAFSCSINLYNEIQTIVFQNITRGDGRTSKYDIRELENVYDAYFLSSIGMMRKQGKVIGTTEEVNIPIVLTTICFRYTDMEELDCTQIKLGIEKLAKEVTEKTKVQAYYTFY